MNKFDNFKFYPSHWMEEKPLRACSIAARGLWIDMICLMHEAHPYGHLTFKDGKTITPEKLAKLVGEDTAVTVELLDELRAHGIFSETPEKIIYSRRLVRDHKKREEGSRSGRAGGGNPQIKAQTKLEIDGMAEAAEAAKGKAQRPDPKEKLPLSKKFVPNDEDIAWAKDQATGVNDKFLNWQTEKFIEYWTSEKHERKTKDAAGWIKAWRNWIGNAIFRYGELDSYLSVGRRSAGANGRGAAGEADRGAKASRADRYRDVKAINADED